MGYKFNPFTGMLDFVDTVEFRTVPVVVSESLQASQEILLPERIRPGSLRVSVGRVNFQSEEDYDVEYLPGFTRIKFKSHLGEEAPATGERIVLSYAI